MSTPINLHSGRCMAFVYPLTKLTQVHFCQASITIEDDLKNKVSQDGFLNKKSLLVSRQLSKVFTHPEPVEETLNIVIRAPPIGKCSLSISSLVLIHWFLIQHHQILIPSNSTVLCKATKRLTYFRSKSLAQSPWALSRTTSRTRISMRLNKLMPKLSTSGR